MGGEVTLGERLRRVEELRAAGRIDDAVAEMELAVSAFARRSGGTDRRCLSLRSALASLWAEDRPDGSRLEWATELVVDCENALGPDDPTTVEARDHVVALLNLDGRHDEASALAERTVTDASRVFGHCDTRTIRAWSNRTVSLVRAGSAAEAAEELRAAIVEMEQWGCDAVMLLSIRRLLARSLIAAGMRGEARDALGVLVYDCQRAFGADAPQTREVRNLLAQASAYDGPFVTDSGSSPRPWVFVADGLRSPSERFGAPEPLRPVPVGSTTTPTRPGAEPPDGHDGGSTAPDGADEHSPLWRVVATIPSAQQDGHMATASAPGGVLVRAIGPLEIAGWTRPPERASQLAEILSYLVFHRDRPVRSGTLRLALRPDLEDEISEETLRAYLSHLRRAVGRETLPHASKDGYRVTGEVTSDWEQFCRLTSDDADASQLEEALGLVRGRPFAGVPEGSFKWVDAEMMVSAMETAIADAARRLATTVAPADPERAEWAVRQGLLAAPYDWALWRLRLELAAKRGPVAFARAHKEAEAVLGDDAASLVE